MKKEQQREKASAENHFISLWRENMKQCEQASERVLQGKKEKLLCMEHEQEKLIKQC